MSVHTTTTEFNDCYLQELQRQQHCPPHIPNIIIPQTLYLLLIGFFPPKHRQSSQWISNVYRRKWTKKSHVLIFQVCLNISFINFIKVYFLFPVIFYLSDTACQWVHMYSTLTGTLQVGGLFPGLKKTLTKLQFWQPLQALTKGDRLGQIISLFARGEGVRSVWTTKVPPTYEDNLKYPTLRKLNRNFSLLMLNYADYTQLYTISDRKMFNR